MGGRLTFDSRALRLVVVLLALSASTRAVVAGLTARNLDLSHLVAQGPVAWTVVPSPHYTVGQDCETKREARCTLRVSSNGGAPPEGLQPLGQTLGPGASAG